MLCLRIETATADRLTYLTMSNKRLGDGRHGYRCLTHHRTCTKEKAVEGRNGIDASHG